MFSYVVYGLSILSTIEFEELVVLDSKDELDYDIIIELGFVSREIQDEILNGRCSNFGSQDMWFHINSVATYWMRNGNRITIDLCTGADIKEVKQYLLGSCLGIIMLQCNKIALHGGSIVFENQGVIFIGRSGAGKSTITSALRLRGYSFVADDVSSIHSDEYHFIQPGFPQQKLCDDTMGHLGYERNRYQTLMGDTQKKYLIPVHNSFVSHPIQLKAIVELFPCEVEDVEVESLSGYDKLMTVYRNIYRIEMKQMAGVDPMYFKKCLKLTKEIPVYRLKRPKNKITVDEQIDCLEQLFITKIEA